MLIFMSYLRGVFTVELIILRETHTLFCGNPVFYMLIKLRNIKWR